jgi:hypothetical protein
VAITIHQEPDLHSAISTPLIITASSTNIGNTGFQWIVKLDIANDSVVYIVSPNPNGYLVFDIVPCVKQYMRNNVAHLDEADTDGSVHSITRADQINIPETQSFYPSAGFQGLGVKIYEAWEVGGVFTENTGSQTTLQYYLYNYLDFTIRDGYKPSLLAQIGHENGDQSRLMSDRLPATHARPLALNLGTGLANAIYLPVYESDWGVWDIRGRYATDGINEPHQIKLSILPSSGPPAQSDIGLEDQMSWSHLPLYPANLNASSLGGIIKPQDYPNWKAIFFQVFDADGNQRSMTYIMYNAAVFLKSGCEDYDRVRLAWVGRRGGWEYFNFIKKSETEYTADQKIAKRVVGNYGAVGEVRNFTFDVYDESDVVTYKRIDKFIVCQSDFLQAGEWEFMKGLVLSKQVHIVNLDGTHTPVIVQDTNYNAKNPKFKGLEQLTIRLKIAQEQPN